MADRRESPISIRLTPEPCRHPAPSVIAKPHAVGDVLWCNHCGALRLMDDNGRWARWLRPVNTKPTTRGIP